ncbi:MAG: carbohydrate kinase [Clostridia bacterium]|nr:carbohydrate kinase [Clostridia bacterium]
MLIGGLDIGTTGCKLSVYSDTGEFVSNTYKEYEVSRRNGEHEVDAAMIFDAVCDIIRTASAEQEIAAIGVTSFGETFTLLDENDNVLLPSMLYTDPRGSAECGVLCEKLGEKRLTYISGVKPHPMYSLPKLMWVKNNRPDVWSKVKRVLLMEDYIVYRLTGIAQIDYSLAARTMALDIREKCWSGEILDAAGIDAGLLSKLVPTGTAAGKIRSDLGIRGDITIVSGCHDQVAAAVGAGILSPGTAVDGTGTVECVTPMFDHVPENEQLYDEGYSVVPYVIDGTYVCYALSFTGGAVLKWFRDNLAAKYEGVDNVYAKLDADAPEAPTGLLVLPHFAGAANPYMDNGSKAAILGLTLEHTSADIYKALMEGVTYEIMLNLEHLESCGITPEKLYATGGGANSAVWLQIKADILNRPVTALTAKEAGACGTCMLAGRAIGIYDSLEDAKKIFVREKHTYLPNSEKAAVYQKYYAAYRKVYDAVRPIIGEVNP